MIKFIENKTPIKICDIGASPKDKTKFIEELFNSTNSTLIGFEPNNDEFEKLEKDNQKNIDKFREVFSKLKIQKIY